MKDDIMTNYNLRVMMTTPNPHDPGSKNIEREKLRVQEHLAWYEDKNIGDNMRIVGFVRNNMKQTITLYCQLLTDYVTIYDCCIEFHVGTINQNKVLDYAPIVGVYSNMLSFTYMYTYVLNKNQMIMKELRHKCSRKALTVRPMRTNPNGYWGVEKSMYATGMFLMTKYANKSIEQIISMPKIKDLETTWKKLENLIATQEENDVIRDMDRKASHSNIRNRNNTKTISTSQGTLNKKKYESAVKKERDGLIISTAKKEAIAASGKKDKIQRESGIYGTTTKVKKLKGKPKMKIQPKGKRKTTRTFGRR